MKKEQILKKVIEKAVKNGWELWGKHFKVVERTDNCIVWVTKTSDKDYSDKYLTRSYDENTIIFDHSFAKAFFGEETMFMKVDKIKILTKANGSNLHKSKHTTPIFVWLYHLSKLALAKDRLKYLEKFLKEDK